MDSDYSDDSSVSGSSYVGSDAPDVDPGACVWRSDRFFDQECSRYFDCPTHVVERASSESNHDDQNERRDGDDGTQTPRQVDNSGGSELPVTTTSTGHLPPPGERGQPAENVVDAVAGLSVRDASPARDSVVSSNRTGAGASSTDPTRLQPRQVLGMGPLAVAADIDDRTISSTSASAPTSDPRGPQRAAMTSSSRSDQLEPPLPPPPLPTPRRDPPLPDTPPAASQGAGGSASSGSSSRTAAAQSTEQAEATTSTTPMTMVFPRWQPDAEVTLCPICHTQFGIFIRKHHCRKCGRVVCNSCSPHRITIPYQFIVQPPGSTHPLAQRYPSSLIRDEGGYADFNSLGGGERVRLCNPCVPDPNTSPPQSTHHAQAPAGPQAQHPHSRSQSNLYGGVRGPTYPGEVAGRPMASGAYSRGRSVTMDQHDGASTSLPPAHPYQSARNRILAGSTPAYFLPPPASSSSAGSRRQQPGNTSASSPSSHRHGLPHQPQYQIAEEDECPVCHRELPSRALPNVDALREAHINICIAAHSSYGAIASSSGSPAVMAAAARQGLIPRGGDAGDLPSSSRAAAPRRTGMFPYFATEKDCVDSAECTICLEEFEVGVPMARLECLCRFHHACISAWFVGHPGRCPVHQHDSFGY